MKIQKKGPLLALLSALLFGVSPVFAKLLVGEMSPILLAGLLYLGSGLGLLALNWARSRGGLSELLQLNRVQKVKLLGSVLSGGVLAPLCFAYGLKLATAIEVSLLLNLETVATTLFAAFIFHEHVSGRVWLGKALLIIGAAFLTITSWTGFTVSFPGLLLVLACVFWGIDNNLTRDVDQLSPVVLASLKGIGAGGFNTCLAYALGVGVIQGLQVSELLALGILSYGVSLVLFIQALRLMGSSRTSTYFASGPFFGMLLAIVILKEHPTSVQWLAAAIMAVGVWTLYGENHEHFHVHVELDHSHPHSHDEHHQHSHEGFVLGEGPHEHLHTHKPMTHAHWHLPDIHHRHDHGNRA